MRIALVALAAWVVGILTALGYVTVSGGWYTYRWPPGSGAEMQVWVNRDNCQPQAASTVVYFRCQRIRWP